MTPRSHLHAPHNDEQGGGDTLSLSSAGGHTSACSRSTTSLRTKSSRDNYALLETATGATVAVAAAAAAATLANNDNNGDNGESLYQELLKFHQEHGDDMADEHSSVLSRQTTSIPSDDDRKLPAKPTPTGSSSSSSSRNSVKQYPTQQQQQPHHHLSQQPTTTTQAAAAAAAAADYSVSSFCDDDTHAVYKVAASAAATTAAGAANTRSDVSHQLQPQPPNALTIATDKGDETISSSLLPTTTTTTTNMTMMQSPLSSPPAHPPHPVYTSSTAAATTTTASTKADVVMESSGAGTSTASHTAPLFDSSRLVPQHPAAAAMGQGDERFASLSNNNNNNTSIPSHYFCQPYNKNDNFEDANNDELVALRLQQEELEQQQQQRQEDEELARQLSKRLELQDAAAAAAATLSVGPLPQPPVVQPRAPSYITSDRPTTTGGAVKATQLEIMETIRREAERKQVELALEQSSSSAESGILLPEQRHGVENQNRAVMADYLLSQQLAMQEWTSSHGDGHGVVGTSASMSGGDILQVPPRLPRPQPVRRSSSERQYGSHQSSSSSSHPYHARETSSSSVSTSHYPHDGHSAYANPNVVPARPRRSSSLNTPASSSSTSASTAPVRRRAATRHGRIPVGGGGHHHYPLDGRQHAQQQQHHEDELVQKGSMETQQAIATGRSHVVQCQGCFGRMHAPISYALVYCPKCHTVSPGQTYMSAPAPNTTTISNNNSSSSGNSPSRGGANRRRNSSRGNQTHSTTGHDDDHRTY